MFRNALVTGNDPETLLHFRGVLGALDFSVESIALEQIPQRPFSVAIVDGRRGASLPRLRALAGRGLLIALGAPPKEEHAREAGADLHLEDARIGPEALGALIREGADRLHRPIDGPLGMIVGRAPRLLSVLQQLRTCAGSSATVLITGETGTGKELAARGIHLLSDRQRGPFMALNCAAIPENLLESEMFGHVRGAFTGAVANRQGCVAAAEGGTLFLDEIGELALPMQAKLLRVLQERVYTPVGGNQPRKADVRVVAATNRDLRQDVARGAFRADLYWRLEVITLELPPLRERRPDILPLVCHVIDRTNHLHQRRVAGVEPAALRMLQGHDWPGNVRELENTIERAVILRGEGPLRADDIILRRPQPASAQADVLQGVRLPPDGLDLHEATAALELLLINQALEQTKGNQAMAARLLHINRTTLLQKLRRGGGAA